MVKNSGLFALRSGWSRSAKALIFLLLVWGVMPLWVQAQPTPSSPVPYPSRGGMGMMNDQRFIVMMIPHHEGAIAMADLALTRAQHPEIKQLAQNIQKSQSQEIQEMQTWYQQWYGTKVPPWSAGQGGMMNGMGHHGMMGMMGGQTDLTTLKNAQNFDQVFIQEMIPHHQMAVMMAQHLLWNTQRPEMKQLAQAIIQSQNQEIQKMQTWYQKWYGKS